MKISVESNIRNYQAYIEKDLSFLDQYTKDENTFFILDDNVAKAHPKLLEKVSGLDVFLLEAVEANKTIEYASKIYDFLINSNAKKNIRIVSIGGGITQDITGFIASTLYRGVGWIYLPTTFLAMTDSCIGSKTSINYNGHKNLLGTFYPPHEIHIYTDFLTTLSRLDFFSGVGESIKLQLMKEEYPKDINQIANNINQLSVDLDFVKSALVDNLNVKIAYIADDEFDQGRRNLLNYGHCLGHALETASEYYVPHGIAVTIGMIYANFLSVQRKLLDVGLASQINDELLRPNIPIELRKSDFKQNELLMALQKDKKRIGKHLSSVIPDGELRLSVVNDVTDDEFTSALNSTVNYLF